MAGTSVLLQQVHYQFGSITTLTFLQAEKLEPTVTCCEQMKEILHNLMITIIFYLVIITVIVI